MTILARDRKDAGKSPRRRPCREPRGGGAHIRDSRSAEIRAPCGAVGGRTGWVGTRGQLDEAAQGVLLARACPHRGSSAVHRRGQKKNISEFGAKNQRRRGLFVRGGHPTWPGGALATSILLLSPSDP
ncbi:hypothetical protein HPB50_023338 [Hyalomma asiaticum]|uniref:Uncharacterized protein n=1 Tax=Hyalomma asiaticum TaxID=266040 RepID=A0ACB7TQ38_HYAAI|nr:hypothetical protein HPB50_023338 [Hyalomma asiaticum]